MNASSQLGNLAVALVAGPGLSLQFSGQADSRDGQDLFQYLLDAHVEALEKKVSEVRVDITNVGYMNSSSLSAFVGWVGELQKVEAPRRYRIVLLGKSDKRWQLISLKALAKLAPDQISLSLA